MTDYSSWKPKYNPWLIAFAVLLATVMEILDTSVANVALPHIAGNLSASTDEATWVLTSYLVANAIVIPITAWLGAFFGRKRYFLFSITLFTLASMLCGFAPSLPFLIIARILQGLGGGGLQPTTQAILLESFPPKDRGVAMAAFAMGVIVAPIVGPTLGGWITDQYNWRWLFFINLPVGILALALVSRFVEDPPYLRQVKGQRIDYIGFALLALWVGTFQLIMDKGQEDNWFQAPWIVWGAIVVVSALILFIYRELHVKHPIVDLHVLKNRNLAVACFLVLVLGASLYGTIVIIPLMLQTLMGYTAFISGMAVSPRGFGALASNILMGKVVRRIDNRILNAIGFIIMGLSTWWLTSINLQISYWNIAIPVIASGFAMGFLFVPMTTMAVATLDRHEINAATSLYSLTRNLGGSFGIATVATIIARAAQRHQVYLVGHLTPYDQPVRDWLARSTRMMGMRFGEAGASNRALGYLYGEVQRQARMLGFIDALYFLAIISLVSVPLVFLFHKPKHVVEKPIIAE